MDDHHDRSAVSGAVDYKVLFLGACTLVLVIGGGLVGLWSRTNDNRILEFKHALDGDIGELRRIDGNQWDRIHAIHDAIISNTSRIDQLRERTNDQENRIRTLENELKRVR